MKPLQNWQLELVQIYTGSGSLAQLAEQRTLNPQVPGSSPGRPTTRTERLFDEGRSVLVCGSTNICRGFGRRDPNPPPQEPIILTPDLCGRGGIGKRPRVTAVPTQDRPERVTSRLSSLLIYRGRGGIGRRPRVTAVPTQDRPEPTPAETDYPHRQIYADVAELADAPG